MAERGEETEAVWALEIHEGVTRNEHLELLRLAKTESAQQQQAVSFVLVHVLYKVQAGSALGSVSKSVRLSSGEEVERESKAWTAKLKPYQEAFKLLNVKVATRVERNEKRHLGLCQAVTALGATRLYMFGIKPHFGSMEKEVKEVEQQLPPFCSLTLLQNRKRILVKQVSGPPSNRPPPPLSRTSSVSSVPSTSSSPSNSGRLPVSNSALIWLASGPDAPPTPPHSTTLSQHQGAGAGAGEGGRRSMEEGPKRGLFRKASSRGGDSSGGSGPLSVQGASSAWDGGASGSGAGYAGEREGRITYPTIDSWQIRGTSAGSASGGYDGYATGLTATSLAAGGVGGIVRVASIGDRRGVGPSRSEADSPVGSLGGGQGREALLMTREGSNGASMGGGGGGEGGGESKRLLEAKLRTMMLEAELARLQAALAMNEREAERMAAAEESRRAQEENKRLRREAEERERRLLTTVVKEYSGAEVAAGCNEFAPNLQIGSGGFAGVWRGMLDFVPVAIKKLNDAESSDAGVALQKEINLQAGLYHPHVLRLFGFCASPPCLITEYMEEGSLDAHLTANGKAPLTWHLRFEIFDEVCQGVAALHARHPPLIHSDLKPGNILLDKNFRAKVGDVGIANLLDNLTPGVSYQDLSVAMGTLDYAAPELALQRQSSCKADVFSLGIVLLDLLRGIRGEKLAFMEDLEEALETMEENKAKGGGGGGGGAAGHVPLMSLLDKSAGEWPLEVAHRLAILAVACCRLERRKRMASVEKMLETLAGMRGLVKQEVRKQREGRRKRSVMEDERKYCCAITQEIMDEPVVAADGHTYEKRAILDWLETHDTSPMTNEVLKHKDLVPNINLKCFIQEWKDKQLQDMLM